MLKKCAAWLFIVVCFCAACLSQNDQNACSGSNSGPTQLFNGKDLSGWKHVGASSMVVEDGAIKTQGDGMGLLYWTGGKIGNCMLRVSYRMQHENDHSGIFVRIPREPREEWMPVHYGYEVRIDNHPERNSPPRPRAAPGKPGPEWNSLEITLEGNSTIVVLIGLQNESDHDTVFFKEISIHPSGKGTKTAPESARRRIVACR